jgi:polysaccharide export outer membrane protein
MVGDMRARAAAVTGLGVALCFVVGGPFALPAEDSYELGPGDIVKVVVQGQADLSGEYKVDAAGMINLPILGKIKASAHSLTDLERKLTTLLADGYLRRPQVTVSISAYGSQRVFVTGEIAKPGPYPLKADRSLFALMSELGALPPSAGHVVVVIRPPTPGFLASDPQGPAPDEAGAKSDSGLPVNIPGAEVFRISRHELMSGQPERNILLEGGDTVYVPKAAQVYVTGSVARPGPYRYEEGMTVLQVLTLAGGVTERGSSGRTKLVRIVNGRKQEIKAKSTDLVEPEDTLVVPERFF